jgi:hypothetical protein
MEFCSIPFTTKMKKMNEIDTKTETKEENFKSTHAYNIDQYLSNLFIFAKLYLTVVL